MVVSNQFNSSKEQLTKLTTQLVNHVVDMDQAVSGVNVLAGELNFSMQSSAGRVLHDKMIEWTGHYNIIKGKLNGVIDALQGAQKQIDSTESNNQSLATKWGDGVYHMLSGSGSGS